MDLEKIPQTVTQRRGFGKSYAVIFYTVYIQYMYSMCIMYAYICTYMYIHMYIATKGVFIWNETGPT